MSEKGRGTNHNPEAMYCDQMHTKYVLDDINIEPDPELRAHLDASLKKVREDKFHEAFGIPYGKQYQTGAEVQEYAVNGDSIIRKFIA